ncbi:plasmid partitioning protein RepA [Roseivivax sp. CAU 1761]
MADGPILHEKIRENARDLSGALERMSQVFFAPADTKTLRSFSTREVTELLGVSAGYLRKAHAEGRLPDIPLAANGQRMYTAEQILEVRRILARDARSDLHKYLPGRKEGDHLQVWSFVNFKGGSAKSTTAIHTAQRLALKGYRVLCIDCDPQASLTTFFGYAPEVDFATGGTIYDAIRYKDPETKEPPAPLRDIVRRTYFPGLDLAPGGLMLSEFEHETPRALQAMEKPLFYERMAAALADVEAEYDVVVIDCPPQLGYVTLSALSASTSMVMTVIPDRIDIASAAQFLTMSSNLLEVLADSGGVRQMDNMRFLITRYDTAVASQVELAAYLRDIFGDQVMKHPFLKSSEVAAAGVSQRSVWEVSPAETNRRTLARILDSVIAVTDEIHEMIQKSWGRT